MRLVSISVLVLIAAYLSGKPAQQPNSGRIQGNVVRDDTDEPLPNAQITLALIGTPANPGGAGPAPVVVLDRTFVAGAENVAGNVQSILDQLNITLMGPSGASTVLTDTRGHYEFRNLAPGDYTVTAQLDGYFGPEWNGSNPSAIRQTLTVEPGEVRTMNYGLLLGGTLSGRILDNLGMPAADITVQAFRLTYNNGIPSLQSGGSRNTDDRGDFRIYRIMPGEYVLAAIPKQAVQVGGRGGVDAIPVGTGLIANSAPSQNSPVRTYFPDTVNIGDAVRIQLHSAEEISGINVRIQTTTAAKISGQVTSSIPADEMVSPSQQAAQITANRNTTITLYPRDKNALQDPATSSSASVALGDPARGQFEIPAVPPGSYELFANVTDIKGYGPAQPPGRASQPLAYGRASLDVNGSDRAGVSILVHHGVDIHGQVTIDGLPSPPAARIGISLQPDDASARIPVYQQVSRFQPLIDSDGKFMIPSVPEARYRVQVTFNPPESNTTVQPVQVSTVGTISLRSTAASAAPALPSGPVVSPNAYVSEIRQEGNSILDTGLFVGAQEVAPVEIRIRTDGGTVEGIVRRPSSAPAANAIVVLAPISHLDNLALYRKVTADSAGEFTFSGIAPGDYRMLAFASLPPNAMQNADFFRRYLEKGTPLAVSPDARLTVQPALISTVP